MTESQGTAEEQIRAKIKNLRNYSKEAKYELEWCLNLIQKENIERAKKLIKLYAESVRLDHDDDHTYMCPVLTGISELSESALRSAAGSEDYEELESQLRSELKAEEMKATHEGESK